MRGGWGGGLFQEGEGVNRQCARFNLRLTNSVRANRGTQPSAASVKRRGDRKEKQEESLLLQDLQVRGSSAGEGFDSRYSARRVRGTRRWGKKHISKNLSVVKLNHEKGHEPRGRRGRKKRGRRGFSSLRRK